MSNNFDLRKFLVENKLTQGSKLLSENSDTIRMVLQGYVYDRFVEKYGEQLMYDVVEDLWANAQDNYNPDEDPEWTEEEYVENAFENYVDYYRDNPKELAALVKAHQEKQ